ncbi:MAG: helix-turn-helix transcriptional regulator [Oscillospiraceae bacterium]|nr:helix-turn-helix transcriptional regulator [Oscillospiraceae bacterium]
MHKKHDILGDVIKSARQNSDFTMESLAAKIGVTERHLYRIENEGQKPSFDVLFKLIRELSIDPDKIFYPEKLSKESEIENLIRMLYSCDNRILKTIISTAKVLIKELE